MKLNSLAWSCKVAKVKPLFKKGYHPVSLLPLLWKIIERIVRDQIKEVLSKNKILYRFQLGLRKNYSTNTCLGHLTDEINSGFKKGFSSGMTLIDLQKALDTIDHQTILKEVKYLSFSKSVIALFKSYLISVNGNLK